MYPLDVTMPQAGCCVAGGLEFGAGSILGSVRYGAGSIYICNWHRWACKLSSTKKKKKRRSLQPA